MKHMKIGLCLAVVLAFGVVGVASASASPTQEWQLCITKKGGKYEKGCAKLAKPGKGKAELKKIETYGKGEVKVAMTKGKGATITVGGKAVKCSADTAKGELDAEAYGTLTVTFTGCVSGANKCTTTGSAAGTIKTEAGRPLALEFLNPGETTLGVTLSAPGFTFASFTCGSEAFTLEGGALGTVKNAKKGIEIVFAVNGAKEQDYTTFWTEGEEYSEDQLHDGATPATLTGTILLASTPKGAGAYAF